MSRTRIVGGKYTKLTKENHYMFSDDNISTSSLETIHEEGIDDGILHGMAKEYEPWKNYQTYKKYYGYIAHTINERVKLTELDLNIDVKTCLTCITLNIKHEAYDKQDKYDNKKEKYYLHNWLQSFSIFINNRGEIVRGSMDIITYDCEYTIAEEYQTPGRRIPHNLTRFNVPLAKSGKELHDEIFLDKVVTFKNNKSLPMDYEGEKGDGYYYNKLAAFLVEASIFNRVLDFSYVFAINNQPDGYFKKLQDYTNLTINFPLLENAIEKWGGVSLFKKYFGFFSYLQNLLGVIDDFRDSEYIRGPVQLSKVVGIFSNDKGKTKTTSDEQLATITIDTSAIYELLKKKNK